jgi:hypothetical protein
LNGTTVAPAVGRGRARVALPGTGQREASAPAASNVAARLELHGAQQERGDVVAEADHDRVVLVLMGAAMVAAA